MISSAGPVVTTGAVAAAMVATTTARIRTSLLRDSRRQSDGFPSLPDVDSAIQAEPVDERAHRPGRLPRVRDLQLGDRQRRAATRASTSASRSAASSSAAVQRASASPRIAPAGRPARRRPLAPPSRHRAPAPRASRRPSSAPRSPDALRGRARWPWAREAPIPARPATERRTRGSPGGSRGEGAACAASRAAGGARPRARCAAHRGTGAGVAGKASSHRRRRSRPGRLPGSLCPRASARTLMELLPVPERPMTTSAPSPDRTPALGRAA